MLRTDQKLDGLASQMVEMEKEMFSEDGAQVEVFDLLKTVSEVTSNYENLRKEIVEVQDLQKQLSSRLQIHLKTMQSRINSLKEKLCTNVPQSSCHSVPNHVERARNAAAAADQTNY